MTRWWGALAVVAVLCGAATASADDRTAKREARALFKTANKHYNEGDPVYAVQVLGVAATLNLKGVRHRELLRDRTIEIVWRLARLFVRGWSEPRS